MTSTETLAVGVRPDFPFFAEGIAGDGSIYLDSAATSLRPRAVIAKLVQFYSEISANVARGAYVPAEVATRMFEHARTAVAERVGFDEREVVFTGGCTAAINQVAAGLTIPAGKSVAVSLYEHHANLLPWMARYPLVWFDPLHDGIESLDRILGTGEVGLLAVTACSNVSGAVLPVRQYAEVAHGHGVPVLADAAQLAPHFWDELAELGADFVTLSAHKMLGPFGLGVLAAREDWLDQLTPHWYGGGAVEEVTRTSFRLRPGPQRFEAGTPPVAEAVAFAEALDYYEAVGPDRIAVYEQALLDRMLERLRRIPHIGIVDDEWSGPRVPLVSVYVEDDLISADQLGRMLYDRFRISARAGHHCAHPYVTARGLNGTLRFAASFYNTFDEIDRASDALEEIVRSLL